MSRLKGFTILVMLFLALLVAVSTRASESFTLEQRVKWLERQLYIVNLQFCTHVRVREIGGTKPDALGHCLDEVEQPLSVRTR